MREHGECIEVSPDPPPDLAMSLWWEMMWLVFWSGLLHIGAVDDKASTYKGLWDKKLEEPAQQRRRAWSRWRHSRTKPDWNSYRRKDHAIKSWITSKKRRAADRPSSVGPDPAGIQDLKAYGRPQSSHVSLDPLGRSLIEVGREDYCSKMDEARAWHGSITEESFAEQRVS